MDNGYHDELELDLLDFCKQLILKCKWIILVMIIAAAVSVAFHARASVAAENEEVTQEQIDEAREALSESKAAETEYLYAQYISYIKYRKSIQKYMSDSLYEDDDYEGNISKIKLYFVDSDIENVNQVFARLSLGINEFDKIAGIMGKDRTMMDDVYRRVTISDIQNRNNEETNIVIQESGETEQRKSLLMLSITAESIEQADEITKVVEAAFEREVKELRTVDPQIRMSEIDSVYSNNISGFLNARQNTAISYLNTVNDQISSLQTNYVDKLDSNQKSYYNLLKTRDELREAPVVKPSLMKYLVIGAFLGFAISVFWFMLRYIFDGKAKTSADVELLTGCENIDTVCRNRGNGSNASIAGRIYGCKASDEEEKIEFISTDMKIKMERTNSQSAYLICDDEGSAKELAEKLKVRLCDSREKLSILSGDPLSNAKELDNLAVSDGVFMLARLNNSKRKDLKKRAQLCNRYDLPLLGVVSIRDI